MEALKTIYGSDSDDDAGDGETPMNCAEFKEMTKKMQIPLLYAAAIIGIEEKRISYIQEPEAGSCRNHDAGQRSYSQMPTSGYYPSQSYGRYESSDITGPY
ncbi:hypothetical protein J5N97_001123 [Dioscorea zingiberensis]|uniref:Uncharacterized protein n=1 Tax=Dioscorea zingiberensis TaxID=325984 RepID=A0A9D5BVT6_9LILI|nr:hypothetical protein J5N97_001123 [Dioscorea zingiberensis]